MISWNPTRLPLQVGSNVTQEDLMVDGRSFDDDIAINVGDLARSVNSGDAVNAEPDSDIVWDTDGNLTLCSGPDNELTDNDAKGNTDPDFEMDNETELMASKNHNTEEQPIYKHVAILPVHRRKLRAQTDLLSDVDCNGRYVTNTKFEMICLLNMYGGVHFWKTLSGGPLKTGKMLR
jgi:hypothetical protein